MSRRATDWAFSQKLPPVTKLVLLALADRHNNDTNRCDPSMEKVADDCSVHRDSVRKHVKTLVDKGLLTVHERWNGPVRLTNFYSFNIEGVPAGFSGVPIVGGEGVPSQIGTNQEVKNQEGNTSTSSPTPSVQLSTKEKTKGFAAPNWIDPELWDAFEEMRVKQRKPMTDTARLLIIRKLEQFDTEGHSVGAVLEQSIVNGWQDVYKIKQEFGGKNGGIPNGKANANMGVLARVIAQDQRANDVDQNGDSQVRVGGRNQSRGVLGNSRTRG